MKFSIHQDTRIGGRHSNQDRAGYVYTDQSLMLIICDGMGGHKGGELAAQYVVEYAAKMFRKNAQPKVQDPTSFLLRTLIGAHHGIINYAKDQGLSTTPRTTCVICIIQDGSACWANVGDSRLYHIKNSSLASRTTDHSYVQSLVDKGLISSDEAHTHPDKHKIYSCLGQEVIPKIDVCESTLLDDGDALLLATDGLWGVLPVDFICKVIQGTVIKNAIPLLIDAAESIAGLDSDNITAIGLLWGSQEIDELEQPTVRDIDVEIALDLINLRKGV